MTCSSVHISSWIGLWLLNFCHPPETICSGLHCWKERTMGKKNSIQISRLLCLRDAAAEFMACSTGVGRKHYQNVHPCAQPTVECTPRLHFMGHNVYLKSPGNLDRFFFFSMGQLLWNDKPITPFNTHSASRM